MKAVSIPTIVIKIRGNDLMIFDIWCEYQHLVCTNYSFLLRV